MFTQVAAPKLQNIKYYSWVSTAEVLLCGKMNIRKTTMIFSFCYKFVLLVWVTCFFDSVCAGSLYDADDLYQDLMVTSKYNKRTRPVLDQDLPVDINVTFSLVNIQNFDELSGELSVVGVINAWWVDERLVWDPDAYNGTYTLMIPQKELWKPHLVLVNPYDSVDVLGHESFDIRIYPDGAVVWNAGDVIKSTCSVDISLYPFDVQTCLLQFVSWGYSGDEVRFSTPSEKFELGYYTPNGEWELINSATKSITVSSMSMVEMHIKMKRRSDFYIVNVVLPIIFLCFLNAFVFVLPAESGERVSYAITVLLALAVFLTLVSDHMPKSSQPMAYLSYFMMMSLIASTIICLLTILLLRLHHKDDSVPVPNWVYKLTICLQCHGSCQGNRIQPTRNKMTNQKREWEDSYEEPAADYDLSWKDVSDTLGNFFFIFFTVTVAIIVTCFFVSLVLIPDENQDAFS